MINNSNSSSVNYASILKSLEEIGRRSREYRDLHFYAHPDAYAVLPTTADGKPLWGGIPVSVNTCLPKHPKKWQFPSDPFVEYEASDEEWARSIRYGSEVDDTSNHVMFAVDYSRYKSFLTNVSLLPSSE